MSIRKKPIILGTGLTGLVGSRIVELLSNKYYFEDISLETGIDIRNKDKICDIVRESSAGLVLHLAAKTDVDACEKEKHLGEISGAWQINVVGTKNLVEACQQHAKRFIYISTDFVFDGTRDSYDEDDEPSPVNFYGLTKYEGEKQTLILGSDALVCRISYPYRSNFTRKKDIVRSLHDKITDKKTLEVISNQYIVPTFIDDIAECIHTLIQNKSFGIYHIVGSEAITPFNLAKSIMETYNLSTEIIPVLLEKYYKCRAKRPYKSVLNNDKMKLLGVHLHGIREALPIIKSQQESLF